MTQRAEPEERIAANDEPLTPYEQAPEHIKRLLRILSVRRKHGSVGEEFFYDVFLHQYQPAVFIDDKGEDLAYVLTHEPDESNPSGTLWSCHIDTVHGTGDEKLQNIVYDPQLDAVFKEDKECLGADNGAGVWLLLEMFDAGVPGTYVFHRGEECGGIGSRGMAKHHAEWLKQFKRAIAFDRRKDCSIITRQMVGKCCSDEFADELSKMLSDDVYELKKDTTGSFTDTASYVDLIPECTNVSVGYYNEHGGDETLDVEYVKWLRLKMIDNGAACRFLITKREPGDKGYSYYGGWQGRGWGDDDDWGYGYGGYGYPRYGEAAKDDKPEEKDVTPRLVLVSGTLPASGEVSAYQIDKLSDKQLRKWVNGAKDRRIVEVLRQLAEDMLATYTEYDEVVQMNDELLAEVDEMRAKVLELEAALDMAQAMNRDDDNGERYAG